VRRGCCPLSLKLQRINDAVGGCIGGVVEFLIHFVHRDFAALKMQSSFAEATEDK
jgi:hypothetical protein